MPKLTVTFPDDFYKKIKLFKESKKLNLSGEFRKCIERKITQKETLEKPLSDDEKYKKIAERLRLEREEVMENYKIEGVDSVIPYLEEAHYEEIVDLVKWYQSNDGIPKGDKFELFSDYLHNYIDESPEFDLMDYHRDDYGTPIWLWLDGIKLGVSKFWEKVKSEL